MGPVDTKALKPIHYLAGLLWLSVIGWLWLDLFGRIPGGWGRIGYFVIFLIFATVTSAIAADRGRRT